MNWSRLPGSNRPLWGAALAGPAASRSERSRALRYGYRAAIADRRSAPGKRVWMALWADELEPLAGIEPATF